MTCRPTAETLRKLTAPLAPLLMFPFLFPPLPFVSVTFFHCLNATVPPLRDLGDYRLVGLDPGQRMMLTMVVHPQGAGLQPVRDLSKLPVKRLSQAHWRFSLRRPNGRRRSSPRPNGGNPPQQPSTQNRSSRQHKYRQSREERTAECARQQEADRTRKQRRRRRQEATTARNSHWRECKRRERELYDREGVDLRRRRRAVTSAATGGPALAPARPLRAGKYMTPPPSASLATSALSDVPVALAHEL